MNLAFPPISVAHYTSSAQIARVLTESWASQNMYCAACDSYYLAPTKTNARAVDLICPTCREGYQLKSGKTLPLTRIVDAAYGAMITSIRSDADPNLLYLHYSMAEGVKNLFLVPRFFFAESCIEERKPLSSTARRAGWIGCNIRLDRIALDGRIQIVTSGAELSKQVVRGEYSRLTPLMSLDSRSRGWTLNVFQLLTSFGSKEFSLAEAYRMEEVLAARFPNNRNVRPKIRQQLQVLRDLGVITFLGRGHYRLRG